MNVVARRPVIGYETQARSVSAGMRSAVIRGLGVVCLLLLAACGDEGAAEGESCETAADCGEGLVCALKSEDGDSYVCADYRDTYPELMCSPGADLTMPCDVVLKGDTGEPCRFGKQCLSGTCSASADAGADPVCE